MAEGIAGHLRMFAAAAEVDAPRGVAAAYREWADILERGGTVDDLPPLGQATVAAIEEGAI